ncbi:MAG: ATP-grasp domain-containing protein [Spirochaetales bacterium]|nr:ATP-grasp domain-containing protein [Spirochaetales bacterium]
MTIGLTYDLRSRYLSEGYSEEETAEFDSPVTVGAIAGALEELGHRVVHVGSLYDLTGLLVAGKRWDLVFNIAEGLYGLGREAVIPALLDAYRIPYTFSDPAVMALCLHKGFTKNVLRDMGVPTPEFAVVAAEEELDELDGLGLAYPLFAKPVAEGTGKGVTPSSRIESAEALAEACRELLGRYRQPVLVEEYLPGREFTVGILGTGRRAQAAGVLEVVLLPQAEQGVYSYANKERSEELVEYRTPRDPEARAAEEVALQAWRALGCRDAGRVDVRSDRRGRPNVIELNPLAGLHPTHSDLPMIADRAGLSYLRLIGEIVDSARRRVPEGQRVETVR